MEAPMFLRPNRKLTPVPLTRPVARIAMLTGLRPALRAPSVQNAKNTLIKSIAHFALLVAVAGTGGTALASTYSQSTTFHTDGQSMWGPGPGPAATYDKVFTQPWDA